MNKAWERLSQCKRFRVVLGWIRSTEVTRAVDGTAHPHFHVLLLVASNYFTKNYLTQAQWVEMWRGAARLDYSPIVDIRRIKGAAGRKEDLLPAVRETLKYSVKPSDMKADVPWFLVVTLELKNLRFIASGGILKGVLRAEQESETDLLLLRDAQTCDEKASEFFGWRPAPRRYKRTRPGIGKPN